jgi:hypothetical protein
MLGTSRGRVIGAGVYRQMASLERHGDRRHLDNWHLQHDASRFAECEKKTGNLIVAAR